MDNKHRLYIVDDHQLIIDGIHSMLKSEEEWEIIGYANDGEEAVRNIPALRPDVVLMDLDMPKMNGLLATEKLLTHLPELKIIILTLHHEKAILQKLVKLGAAGYILKNSPKDEFLNGLKQVREGNKFYSSLLTESLLDVSKLSSGGEANVKLLSTLSDREREVLQFLSEGTSTREMAEMLHLSTKTIETYRKNLLNKLEARNSADLIRIAIKEGLIEM